jgi:hypothetical protein
VLIVRHAWCRKHVEQRQRTSTACRLRGSFSSPRSTGTAVTHRQFSPLSSQLYAGKIGSRGHSRQGEGSPAAARRSGRWRRGWAGCCRGCWARGAWSSGAARPAQEEWTRWLHREVGQPLLASVVPGHARTPGCKVQQQPGDRAGRVYRLGTGCRLPLLRLAGRRTGWDGRRAAAGQGAGRLWLLERRGGASMGLGKRGRRARERKGQENSHLRTANGVLSLLRLLQSLTGLLILEPPCARIEWRESAYTKGRG